MQWNKQTFLLVTVNNITGILKTKQFLSHPYFKYNLPSNKHRNWDKKNLLSAEALIQLNTITILLLIYRIVTHFSLDL